MSGEVFLDPAEKSVLSWRVLWCGFVCTPVFQDKGSALAYLAGLEGGREPEFRCSCKPGQFHHSDNCPEFWPGGLKRRT